MLVRDKVGKKLLEAMSEVKEKQVEIVSLQDNEDFLKAILSKIKSELDVLETTRSVDSLAEVMELIDWIQVCFGSSRINEVIEHRKDKLGLYWERFYIKETEEE